MSLFSELSQEDVNGLIRLRNTKTKEEDIEEINKMLKASGYTEFGKKIMDEDDTNNTRQTSENIVTEQQQTEEIEIEVKDGSSKLQIELIRFYEREFPKLAFLIKKDFKLTNLPTKVLVYNNEIIIGENAEVLTLEELAYEIWFAIYKDMIGVNEMHMGIWNNTQMKFGYKKRIDFAWSLVGITQATDYIYNKSNQLGVSETTKSNIVSYVRNNINNGYTPKSIDSYTHLYTLFNETNNGLQRTLSEIKGRSWSEGEANNLKIEIYPTGKESKNTISIDISNKVLSYKCYGELIEMLLGKNKKNRTEDDGSSSGGSGEIEQEIEEGTEQLNEQVKSNLENKVKNFNKEMFKELKTEEFDIILDKEPNTMWRKELKMWIDFYLPRKTYSYSKPNKKLRHMGLMMPSPIDMKTVRDMGHINIYIDVSSSIRQDQIKLALEQVRDIYKKHKQKINVKTFNTEVKTLKLKSLNEIISNNKRLALGGSTDIKVVMEDIEKTSKKQDINIIVTDGDFNWNIVNEKSSKGYRMAFLLTEENKYSNIIIKKRNLKVYEII